MPLLIFLVILVSRIKPIELTRQFLQSLVGWSILTGFFLWISLGSSSYSYLPLQFSMIQMPFRSVSYLNLMILLGLWLVLGLPTTQEYLKFKERTVLVILTFCMTWSGVCVLVKEMRAEYVKTFDADHYFFSSSQSQDRLYHQGLGLGAHPNYSVPKLVQQMSKNEQGEDFQFLRFNLGLGSQFGTVDIAQIETSKRKWIRTNIQIFPWNQIWVNGEQLNVSQLRFYDNRQLQVTFKLPPGKFKIEYRCLADPVWMVLYRMSQVVFVLFLSYVLIGTLRRIFF